MNYLPSDFFKARAEKEIRDLGAVKEKLEAEWELVKFMGQVWKLNLACLLCDRWSVPQLFKDDQLAAAAVAQPVKLPELRILKREVQRN